MPTSTCLPMPDIRVSPVHMERASQQVHVPSFRTVRKPLLLTRLTKPIAQYLRSQGIRVLFYLDDILILSDSESSAQTKAQNAISLLRKIGFSLNRETADMTPRKYSTYLGLQWDTHRMSVCLPEGKVQEICTAAVNLRSRAFLGRMAFAAYAVPSARLHSRERQLTLQRVYRCPADDSKSASPFKDRKQPCFLESASSVFLPL